MTPLPHRAEPEAEINLMELLGVIWRGKYWVALAVGLSLLLGILLVLRVEPIYQASGLLQLEAKSGALALPDGMQDLLAGATSGNSPGETEIEIMRSRMVMGRMVEELGLQIQAHPRLMPILKQLPRRIGLPDPGILRRYSWGSESIIVGELEVPEAWLGEPMPLVITGPDTYRVTLPDGTRHDGGLHIRLALPELGFSLVVDQLDGPQGREFIVTRLALAAAIEEVLQNFSVIETPKRSSILRITYDDPDPRRAEAVLNSIAQSYVSQNISRSAAEAQNSLSFIEEQLPLSEQAVRKAQDALNAYRQQQQSVDVDYETRSLLERATQIEADLNALSLQEDELKTRYTINHPTYQALLQNRTALQGQLQEIREATGNLPETQKEIFNLTRNLEVSQQVYVQLLNRAQELRVVRASTVGSVRIIDTAYASAIPVAPRTGRSLAVHLLVGVVLGVSLVLLRHGLRRGIRGAQEIEQAGLPVFATVNYSPDAANHRKTKGMLPILALMFMPNNSSTANWIISHACAAMSKPLNIVVICTPRSCVKARCTYSVPSTWHAARTS